MKEVRQTEFDKQIAIYQPKLKSFIRNRVANKEDAEDILQEVVYQWVKTVNVTLNPIENLSAWLYRVARNTIINLSVKKKEVEMPVFRDAEDDSEMMRELSDFLFEDDTPETEYLRQVMWEELDTALSELPPEQRSVFELTELDGIPVKEIAETTGVPVATLLSRKHYAVLRLRSRLKVLYDELT